MEDLEVVYRASMLGFHLTLSSPRLVVLACFAALGGCGGTVRLPGESSGAAGASASSATAAGGTGMSGATGAAGTGMGGIGGTGGASGATGATGGAGGTPAWVESCKSFDLFIDVSGDGPDQHFTAPYEYAPPGATGPIGNYAYVSESENFGLLLAGGASAEPKKSALSLWGHVAGLGSASDGFAYYYTAQGDELVTYKDVTMTITADGGIGGVVEGSFTAKVGVGPVPKMVVLTLSGSFRVCRGPDGSPLP